MTDRTSPLIPYQNATQEIAPPNPPSTPSSSSPRASCARSASTSLTHSSSSPPSAPDLLDDIFGSLPLSSPHVTTDFDPTSTHREQNSAEAHPSELPRLRSLHATAGYRDGAAAGREATVQSGFDEGFMLSAALGIRAGEIEGLMEGIVAALRPGNDTIGGRRHGDEHRRFVHLNSQLRSESEERGLGEAKGLGFRQEIYERAASTLKVLRGELGMNHLLSQEHFNVDGTWSWTVPGLDDSHDGDVWPTTGKSGVGNAARAEEEAGVEIVSMARVAASHPLILKWSSVTQEWTKAFGIEKDAIMSSLDGKGSENG